VSNRLMDLSWPLVMPPSPKVVLVALADQADESGTCWPAIPSLCQRTSLGRTAVIEAVKWLEARGAINVSREGRCNRYVVTPDRFDSSASRTDPASAPVRQADQSARRTVRQPDVDQSASRTDQSVCRTSVVRQPDPNPQEPSITPKKQPKERTPPAPAFPPPEGVSLQTWVDWLALRKATKGTVTQTVIDGAIREAGKAGMSVESFLQVWCLRGSRGLQAEWLKPHERGPPVNGARHSAAADFRGKTYAATPDDKLPPGLR
jgi:hypothetical protein